jgi:hypothetical protein
MVKKKSREKRTLVYPKLWFDPEDWLTFIHIQMDGFADEWADLGLADDDLRVLEVMIMAKPRGCPVIQGTGGLRKLRCSPQGWARGKRGALRVLYVYFEEHGIVLPVACYSKGEADSFPVSYKKAYKNLINRQAKGFAKRQVK